MTLVTTAPHYSLLVARGDGLAELRAVQRLRHEVFAGELGARLTGPAPGLDGDDLDELCDHLVVREDATGEVVGCYRMLPPERAAAYGRLYSDGEFDLRALDGLRPSLVETGRSCVHPDHRSGAVMSLMWAGIARYMLLSGHRWLVGCASVPLADGGVQARAVWSLVSARHLSPVAYRVTPHRPWDVAAAPAGRAAVPPLLRGYLRLGAWVCGPPAHDPDFGVADFPVLLSTAGVDRRYLRFFLGETPVGEAAPGGAG
ncbi:MAG TPA: GNAT family N-acyltransferase [Pseudonocardiaceae bacterium]